MILCFDLLTLLMRFPPPFRHKVYMVLIAAKRFLSIVIFMVFYTSFRFLFCFLFLFFSVLPLCLFKNKMRHYLLQILEQEEDYVAVFFCVTIMSHLQKITKII